jgi:hypothetical protein
MVKSKSNRFTISVICNRQSFISRQSCAAGKVVRTPDEKGKVEEDEYSPGIPVWGCPAGMCEWIDAGPMSPCDGSDDAATEGVLLEDSV